LNNGYDLAVIQLYRNIQALLTGGVLLYGAACRGAGDRAGSPSHASTRTTTNRAAQSKTHDLLAFLNNWIQIKKNTPQMKAAYNFWILGQEAVPKKPRWSVIQNVLKWVE
jgi:hypothetical protein